MATSHNAADFTGNSSGQSFESPSNGYSDCSHMVGDPFRDQSMAGGNTTTPKDPSVNAAVGSPSEQTSLNVLGQPHPAAELETSFDVPFTGYVRRGGDDGDPWAGV